MELITHEDDTLSQNFADDIDDDEDDAADYDGDDDFDADEDRNSVGRGSRGYGLGPHTVGYKY